MPSSDKWRWRKHHLVAAGIAMTGAYADVVSVHRWRCFATMLTGNTIWLGRSMLDPNFHAREEVHHDPLFYACIILAFFLGAVLHRWADRTWRARGATRVAPLMGLINVTCEICLLHATGTQEGWERLNWARMKWLVVLYAPLFGVVCTASVDGRLGSPSTVVTGHVINLGKALADAPFKTFTYVEKCKSVLSMIVFVFSILGSCLGAVAYKLNGFSTMGLFLPVSPLFMILLWFHDHLARPRKLVKMYQQATRANVPTEKKEGGQQEEPDVAAASAAAVAAAGGSREASEEVSEEAESDDENNDTASSVADEVDVEAALPPPEIRASGSG
mmetsp:Transcript_91473/g.285115  ORF Transcript_91473/g.285115 Transcript_91473/m.285115 type:complete len:331 (+) Transcript_91473:777-1769(+)|eukprot:CAMPEP_0204589542 /NCGR_PEP_ID=MMETSP0661-20131031/49259_1 /ASSEMBLY_ACC=CAM_ASM_000606 /TAXON_ID=109239 /ORGANISM="Alexandrium margalefi, Strain AMGDE01CS-322" /LENGTH=330 /DNA_ID=CAMNT_0051599471 /DNA_START=66 /DNA_END=1058 /DNA_ORIENTATION=+